MKKNKRFLLILLALSMTFLLVACNKKDVDKNTNEENVTEEVKEDASKNLEGTSLNIVATSESYKEMFDVFTEKTGVKIDFLSMSSGEVISRTKAEGGKPMADIWFGGGLDAFLEAKQDGLLEAYVSPESSDIPAEFKDEEGFWIGKGITIVGFLVNKDVIEEKGLEIPKTWEDLAKPEYKGEIIMSNPAISGTNYAVVNGLLQIMGEEKGWDYFSKLNENIPYYGKRGNDPFLKTTEGEFAIGIVPVSKPVVDAKNEYNVEVVFPEDGIPWVPEGVAIFKNTGNLDGAKAFIDFMISKEGQELIAEIDGKDGSQMVKPGVKGFDIGVPSDKFLKQDLSTFGSDREPILSRWAELVGDK